MATLQALKGVFHGILEIFHFPNFLRKFTRQKIPTKFNITKDLKFPDELQGELEATQGNIEPNFGPITGSMNKKLQATNAMAVKEESIRFEFLEAQQMEVPTQLY